MKYIPELVNNEEEPELKMVAALEDEDLDMMEIDEDATIRNLNDYD